MKARRLKRLRRKYERTIFEHKLGCYCLCLSEERKEIGRGGTAYGMDCKE